MAETVYLAGGARTPIGAFQGALASVTAAELGSAAIRGLLERVGLPATAVDQVIMGNVVAAGTGQNLARQASMGAGIPESTPGLTVNKVCGSGMQSVILAAQAIGVGDVGMVVAGGTESMSQAPHLLPAVRNGLRLGHGEVVDALLRDGLWCVYSDQHMGSCGDACAACAGLSREAQDEIAVNSYKRALATAKTGGFVQEIVPVEVAARRKTRLVSEDEEPARFDEDKLRGLRPAFGRSGTITAGNASSINDGAAALLVASGAGLAQHGMRPRWRLAGYAGISGQPERFPLAPIGAVQALLKRLGWDAQSVDLWEINEAFAMVSLAAMEALKLEPERVNVRGGAVSLGHPIGASGARILVTLLAAMEARAAQRGIATICIGGGEALAVAVEQA